MVLEFINRLTRLSKTFRLKKRATIDVRHKSIHERENFRGEHTINYETCIGCNSCNTICPVHAIEMVHLPLKKQNVVPEVNLPTCIFCGLCEDVCPVKPEKSIKLSGGRFDMLTGGSHIEQGDFWVHANIPQSYIDERLAQEREAQLKKDALKAQKAAQTLETKEEEERV